MAMPPSADRAMELSSVRHGNVVVLSPRGRIDHASAEGFKAALAPYLAQSGPGQPLVQARAQGGKIAVAALGPLVREIFEISKFTLVFPCFASVDDALTDLAARPEPGASPR